MLLHIHVQHASAWHPRTQRHTVMQVRAASGNVAYSRPAGGSSRITQAQPASTSPPPSSPLMGRPAGGAARSTPPPPAAVSESGSYGLGIGRPAGGASRLAQPQSVFASPPYSSMMGRPAGGAARMGPLATAINNGNLGPAFDVSGSRPGGRASRMGVGPSPANNVVGETNSPHSIDRPAGGSSRAAAFGESNPHPMQASAVPERPAGGGGGRGFPGDGKPGGDGSGGGDDGSKGSDDGPGEGPDDGPGSTSKYALLMAGCVGAFGVVYSAHNALLAPAHASAATVNSCCESKGEAA